MSRKGRIADLRKLNEEKTEFLLNIRPYNDSANVYLHDATTKLETIRQFFVDKKVQLKETLEVDKLGDESETPPVRDYEVKLAELEARISIYCVESQSALDGRIEKTIAEKKTQFHDALQGAKECVSCLKNIFDEVFSKKFEIGKIIDDINDFVRKIKKDFDA